MMWAFIFVLVPIVSQMHCIGGVGIKSIFIFSSHCRLSGGGGALKTDTATLDVHVVIDIAIGILSL